MAVSPTQAMELFAESKIEQAQQSERNTKRELAQYKAQAPNHPVARVGVSLSTAAATAHADTMIGDGKGDGVKIGTTVGATLISVGAWHRGNYTIAHAALDAAIGAGAGLVAIATRESGLKAALIREQKRAAAQNAAAK